MFYCGRREGGAAATIRIKLKSSINHSQKLSTRQGESNVLAGAQAMT